MLDSSFFQLLSVKLKSHHKFAYTKTAFLLKSEWHLNFKIVSDLEPIVSDYVFVRIRFQKDGKLVL